MNGNWKPERLFKLLRRRPAYSRFRKFLSGQEDQPLDDRLHMADAEFVNIDWPADLPKPRIGLVKDLEPYPRWTKLCRFLDHNAFEYEIYNIHAHDWLSQAKQFDAVVGIWSCDLHCLQEMREKYWVLEHYLGKTTFPSAQHAFLYEDKRLEAYLAYLHGIPFANAHISYDRRDALELVESLDYPVVSKMVPASASVGTELVRDRKRARKIVERAFSVAGRRTHLSYARQKNYVYFQDFIPNDGFDLRAIVVGDWVFGYYRKMLAGDFRASGMNLVEKRELPQEAMRLALKLNQVVKSPMLVVDMLRGLDGRYQVIEFSPTCQMETPEQLHVNGEPGVFIFDDPEKGRFQRGKYWVAELALREFLSHDYLPRALAGSAVEERETCCDPQGYLLPGRKPHVSATTSWPSTH